MSVRMVPVGLTVQMSVGMLMLQGFMVVRVCMTLGQMQNDAAGHQRRARHQPGDVDELDDGRHDALGRDDGGKLLQARVR